MRRICAWCNSALNDATEPGPISHGICESCAVYVLADKYRLKDFLDTMSAPLLAVDAEGRAITANRDALRALGKEVSQVQGKLGGDVMECEYSRLPGGCGKTIHCSGCQIRRSVNYTRETGQPRVRTKAFMSIRAPGGLQKIDYYVSTERLEAEVVLLRIDEARPVAEPAARHDGPSAGQVNAELGTPGRLASGPDRAAVGFHDGPSDGETDP